MKLLNHINQKASEGICPFCDLKLIRDIPKILTAYVDKNKHQYRCGKALIGLAASREAAGATSSR